MDTLNRVLFEIRRRTIIFNTLWVQSRSDKINRFEDQETMHDRPTHLAHSKVLAINVQI